MELTEKEIVQTLAELPPTNTITKCRYAAHAIFERMQEDVVWEGESAAYVREDGATFIALVPLAIGKHMGVAPDDTLAVTVRRKGGPPG